VYVRFTMCVDGRGHLTGRSPPKHDCYSSRGLDQFSTSHDGYCTRPQSDADDTFGGIERSWERGCPGAAFPCVRSTGCSTASPIAVTSLRPIASPWETIYRKDMLRYYYYYYYCCRYYGPVFIWSSETRCIDPFGSRAQRKGHKTGSDWLKESSCATTYVESFICTSIIIIIIIFFFYNPLRSAWFHWLREKNDFFFPVLPFNGQGKQIYSRCSSERAFYTKYFKRRLIFFFSSSVSYKIVSWTITQISIYMLIETRLIYRQFWWHDALLKRSLFTEFNKIHDAETKTR